MYGATFGIRWRSRTDSTLPTTFATNGVNHFQRIDKIRASQEVIMDKAKSLCRYKFLLLCHKRKLYLCLKLMV